MALNPKRTIAELKELRALTADEHGAQRVAWTDSWLKARDWFRTKCQGLPAEQHYDAAPINHFRWSLAVAASSGLDSHRLPQTEAEGRKRGQQ